MKKVNPSNFEQFGSGTLIKTFDKLDEVSEEDSQKVIQAAQFQAKVSQELEERGWNYEEDIGDWIYYL